jgi:hypothetical protein
VMTRTPVVVPDWDSETQSRRGLDHAHGIAAGGCVPLRVRAGTSGRGRGGRRPAGHPSRALSGRVRVLRHRLPVRQREPARRRDRRCLRR